jgi:hypothetical protein
MPWVGLLCGVVFAGWGVFLYVKRDAVEGFWKGMFGGREYRQARINAFAFFVIGVLIIIGSLTNR